MAVYFFDSSAIVKQYVSEVGSTWVRSITDSQAANRIYLAGITGPEVVAAVVRRQRAGSISAENAAAVLSDFRQDFAAAYRVVHVSAVLVVRAMNVAERHGLRGYDAVQLAAALRVNDECQALGLPLTLVSADGELNDAARADGLMVEDPNSH